VAVIAANAFTIGLETYPWAADRHGELLHVLDRMFLAVFLTLK
jgi:hypothetical protein